MLPVILVAAFTADLVEMTNGEVFKGSMIGRAGDTIMFRSETLGEVKVPVAGVARTEPPMESVAILPPPPPKPIPPPVEWSGFSDAGLSLARGNARTTTFTFGANATRTTASDKMVVGLTSIYAQAFRDGRTEASANAHRLSLRFDRNLARKQFLFTTTAFEYDEFQKLDLRSLLGAGYGRKLVDMPRATIELLMGANVNREAFKDITRRSAEALLSEESSHKINDIFTLKHKIVLYPNLTERGEYRVSFDGTAITTLTRWLAWQVTLSDRYLSNPVEGTQRNDLLLTTGLRTTFGAKK